MVARAIDSVTKDWIRNRSDELAAEAGCRFDPEHGQFVVDWIQHFCKLYEGSDGDPMILRDWQLEATMRLFGWVRYSEQWGREVRRFRQASIWVPKKNKKSPTLAAWGLYLLCGDGEPGQKVYLAAKDGQQSREIAGKHVIEMLAKSAELKDECSVNQNLLQVTHEPSRSILRPLSSANSRTQQSKEGLNGSILIDETHVVDREFVNRISRAGISRAEPLHIEVSTAGNNPDGYGQERFKYAEKVERGEVRDDSLFVMIHAAPQDLEDGELDADPLKYGRLANPAMGHTVDPEEYLADYQRSKVSLASLAEFKMYRLNIWQNSASPWLKMADWDACRDDFTEEDLEGQDCWAALDLSRTQDMSALVLMFRHDGGYRVLPYFWLPEGMARRNSHLASFMEWEKSGHLILTPGDVVDYGYIRATFRKLAKRFNIQGLYFDRTYAEEMTQALEQGVADDTGHLVEEGTGITREAFPQNVMAFAGPTAEFERLVIAGQMGHNGHPVMTWQIGNASVKTDANGNRRPVKPKKGDIRKIDGVVAAIMALQGAQSHVEEPHTPGVYAL